MQDQITPQPHVPSIASHPLASALIDESTKAWLGHLHLKFETKRQSLLSAREKSGRLDFSTSTASIRESSWQAAPPPPDLEKRWVEITGPAEPKMILNALNSGADAFMADLEDALSPTWENILQAHLALKRVKARELTVLDPKTNRKIELQPQSRTTLLVRPRGWHLPEPRVGVGGQPMSASLFDFGLHVALTEALSGGLYFYLPKLESAAEARLWAEAFETAEAHFQIPRGRIRCTVLIETLPAVFQMHEILWELRHWIVGLNAGRWDYLFSAIKTTEQEAIAPLFPDRSQLTMTAPFMRAYAEELVRVAHARGVHAMGGMSAFIPSRRNAEINERALEQVRRDKDREASQGFDGTWVAHPDLIATARDAFAKRLGEQATQKQIGLDRPPATRETLLPSKSTLPSDAELTRDGLRANIDVCLRYLSAWLGGMGAVAIHNLMEDAATAEIARAQLWQACHSSLSPFKPESVLEELETVAQELSLNSAEEFGPSAHAQRPQATGLLLQLTRSAKLISFLTLPALEALERESSRDRLDVNRERRAPPHSPTTKGDQL